MKANLFNTIESAKSAKAESAKKPYKLEKVKTARVNTNRLHDYINTLKDVERAEKEKAESKAKALYNLICMPMRIDESAKDYVLRKARERQAEKAKTEQAKQAREKWEVDKAKAEQAKARKLEQAKAESEKAEQAKAEKAKSKENANKLFLALDAQKKAGNVQADTLRDCALIVSCSIVNKLESASGNKYISEYKKGIMQSAFGNENTDSFLERVTSFDFESESGIEIDEKAEMQDFEKIVFCNPVLIGAEIYQQSALELLQAEKPFFEKVQALQYRRFITETNASIQAKTKEYLQIQLVYKAVRLYILHLANHTEMRSGKYHYVSLDDTFESAKQIADYNAQSQFDRIYKRIANYKPIDKKSAKSLVQNVNLTTRELKIINLSQAYSNNTIAEKLKLSLDNVKRAKKRIQEKAAKAGYQPEYKTYTIRYLKHWKDTKRLVYAVTCYDKQKAVLLALSMTKNKPYIYPCVSVYCDNVCIGHYKDGKKI